VTILSRVGRASRPPSPSFSSSQNAGTRHETASESAVCRANGDLTLTRLQRVGPSPRVERGERQRFAAARDRRLSLPSRYGRGARAAGGVGLSRRMNDGFFPSSQSAGTRHETASESVVCRANGDLTLTRLQRVGPSPRVAMLYPHLACESRAVAPKGPKGRKSLARLARAWKAAPHWIRTAPEGGGTNGTMLSVLCRPFGACGLCGAENPGAYAGLARAPAWLNSDDPSGV
jgi:hypothetical protein